MNPDYKELLSAFHGHGVKYLVVGGYAVTLHAQPRGTKDIDLFIQADPGNARAVYAALAEFGVPLEGVHPENFADRTGLFRWGHEPRAVDILCDIPGVDFDAAWERRVESTIDPATGLKAFFISRDDLIAAKLASGRPQDLADVDAIRRAIESQGPSSAQRKSAESAPDSTKEPVG